jgi:hypothetical protein
MGIPLLETALWFEALVFYRWNIYSTVIVPVIVAGQLKRGNNSSASYRLHCILQVYIKAFFILQWRRSSVGFLQDVLSDVPNRVGLHHVNEIGSISVQ